MTDNPKPVVSKVEPSAIESLSRTAIRDPKLSDSTERVGASGQGTAVRGEE